ncbi:thiol reductant ABC exporter subunit CydC [Rathayibacter sp. KR2-224]|uniref:thiol reductant ABC exporter subunit CydC n=1 Tax=Rathayibacter sp. KR2-224 TaxID=3400913 RepID=UPI003C0F6D21
MRTVRRAGTVEGLGEVGKRRLMLLGLFGALKALGLVLVADALAAGVVAVIAHADTGPFVAEGFAGALVRALAVWGLRVGSQSAAAGVKQQLRIRLARSYLRRTGGAVGADASLAATGLDELDAYYTSYLPSLVSAATVPLLVGARILAADWVSAAVIVATVPLIPFFMALIGMHTSSRVAASLDALGRLSDHLVELARGLPVLVGLGRDREQAKALEEISDAHRLRSMTALRVAFLSSLALDLLASVSVAVVAVIIGIRLLHGELGLHAGLVALILAPECYAPLREVGAAFHASDTGREALRRVRRALAGAPVAPGLRRREGRSVVVHDLTIRYQGRTRPAVAGLSFRAPERGVTLLTGESGAGKSSVLAVLAGRGALLDADAACTGGIVTPPAPHVAWMPQHPHFSSRTVHDEVETYDAAAPQEPPHQSMATSATSPHGRVLTVLDRVGLRRLAMTDPAELSPGEARRLAFARVLAAVDAGARLVLLDEPTAHLDADSAAGIRREIARLRERVTVVVASHDAQLRTLADRVVAVTTAGSQSEPFERPVDDGRVRPGVVQGQGTSAGDGTPDADADGQPETRALPRRADSPQAAGHPLLELRAVLRPIRWRMTAAVLLGMLSSSFAIALTVLSGWLIVRASQEPAIMYLLVAIVGVRFFGIGRSVLRYAERLMTHDAVFRATTSLRLRLWSGLSNAGPAGRHALSPASALSTLVHSADRVRDLVPRVVQPPAVAATLLAGATVALELIRPQAAAVVACIAAIALLLAPAIAFLAGRRAARRSETARADVLTSFTDLLVARDDLTPAASHRIIGRIDLAGAEAARGERRTSYAEGAASALVVFACCCASVAMLALAGGAVASGALRPELVAVLALVPLALTEPLLDAVTAASRAPALLGVLDDVRAATDIAPGVSEQGLPGPGPDEPGAIVGLRLENAAFRYPDAPRPVFSQVQADVRSGQWLAVTGPSGSGKSTLLALLLRFTDPDSGRYLLDESGRSLDAREISPHALRTRVAWCPQEGHLFDSTLRANLVIARPRSAAPTDGELMDALARVGLAPLVATLPLGLDTRIGSAGERLSGGQRQRVAVARTLLAGGDVVLLDEPTAQLDEQASARLMADLRVALRDRTTVLVTHDAAEAEGAEHVVELGVTTMARVA